MPGIRGVQGVTTVNAAGVASFATPQLGFVRGAVITFSLVGAVHHSYLWTHSAPVGSSAGLSDVSSGAPTLTPDVAGDAWMVVLNGLNEQGLVEATYLLPLGIPDTALAQFAGPLALAYLHPTTVDTPPIGQVLFQDWSQGGAVSVKDASGVTRQVAIVGGGATGARPDSATLAIGASYFDTTLGFSVWWNGTDWVDSNGDPT